MPHTLPTTSSLMHSEFSAFKSTTSTTFKKINNNNNQPLHKFQRRRMTSHIQLADLIPKRYTPDVLAYNFIGSSNDNANTSLGCIN
eukprot:UN10664